MGRKFLALHRYRIGELDSSWNVFDRCDADTKLVHYTNLSTQPWKFSGHPYEEIWFSYFREAREAGSVSNHDLDLTIQRGFARPDIRDGNRPRKVKAFLKRLGR